jgi:hypothetical protein
VKNVIGGDEGGGACKKRRNESEEVWIEKKRVRRYTGKRNERAERGLTGSSVIVKMPRQTLRCILSMGNDV